MTRYRQATCDMRTMRPANVRPVNRFAPPTPTQNSPYDVQTLACAAPSRPTHAFLPTVTLKLAAFAPSRCARINAGSAPEALPDEIARRDHAAGERTSQELHEIFKSYQRLEVKPARSLAIGPAPYLRPRPHRNPISWPAGAGRPGCRAGPLHRSYAQGPAGAAGRADRDLTACGALGVFRYRRLGAASAARRGRAASAGGSRRAGRHGPGRGAGSSSSRRPRPTEARRCSSDMRRFSGCSSSGISPRGPGSRSAPGPAIRRFAACAAPRLGIRSGCGGMKAAGASTLRQRRLRVRRLVNSDGFGADRPDGDILHPAAIAPWQPIAAAFSAPVRCRGHRARRRSTSAGAWAAPRPALASGCARSARRCADVGAQRCARSASRESAGDAAPAREQLGRVTTAGAACRVRHVRRVSGMLSDMSAGR